MQWLNQHVNCCIGGSKTEKIHKLCLDNAGETKKLELRLKSVAWKNPVVITYTARDTPQQNLLVEVGFYALVNKAHATMHHASLHMEMWYQLSGGIFTTVTLLGGLTVIDLNGECTMCYNHFLVKHQVLLIICTL